ncbi:uncharacterized protein LOC144119708 [Amblyomma americanum]
MKDGGGGDGMEDFANYCRSQGFPLPGQIPGPKMPSARLNFRCTGSEAARVEAIESTGDGTAKGWLSSRFKKMAAYVIYVAAAALILWQSRSLHINELSASGCMLLSQRLFVILTLVLICVKLALGFRDFHSQLHNEEYIPSKGTASGAIKDGDGGDDMDDFEDFCRCHCCIFCQEHI